MQSHHSNFNRISHKREKILCMCKMMVTIFLYWITPVLEQTMQQENAHSQVAGLQLPASSAEVCEFA